jgi:hypothetical protein
MLHSSSGWNFPLPNVLVLLLFSFFASDVCRTAGLSAMGENHLLVAYVTDCDDLVAKAVWEGGNVVTVFGPL